VSKAKFGQLLVSNVRSRVPREKLLAGKLWGLDDPIGVARAKKDFEEFCVRFRAEAEKYAMLHTFRPGASS
jgi:hypothetical protein